MATWEGVAGTVNLPRAAALSRPVADPGPPALLAVEPLAGEAAFYGSYEWCLDAFPRVAQVVERLRAELGRLDGVLEGWQREEVTCNVFLLGCALGDSLDDYLGGDGYDFSKAESVLPWVRPLTRGMQWVLELRRRQHQRRSVSLRAWRETWRGALDAFLRAWLAGAEAALAAARADLAGLAARALPAVLRQRRVKVPAAFRTQDLAHHDILELARRCAQELPDRRRPLLVVGLRTAGSYFAPLVRAALRIRGYEDVDQITLRPKKRIAPWEQAALARCAARGGRAVVVDEPADTGSSLARALDVLRQAGLPPSEVVALLPVHPTRRDWRSGYESLPLARTRVLTLEPEDWFKHRALEPAAVQDRLREYFRARGYAEARVLGGGEAEPQRRHLARLSEEKFHSRLKRVFAVRLVRHGGTAETRHVLAKSVGWGWLGYHAFTAARHLAGFVPPLIGQRDGILYMEWVPEADAAAGDRDALVARAASYVAARVRTLRLPGDLAAELDRDNQKGLDLLACTLSGACGPRPAAVLRRMGLRQELSARPCPVPTLIDGRMRRQEWVRGAAGFVKTDFEHHGLGKTELNLTDPAYDLADAILHLGLAPRDEALLLERYRAECDDPDVEERLFLYKILAGTAAVKVALANVRDRRLAPRHDEFNRGYVDAREFLTLQAARACGRVWPRPAAPAWRPTVAMLDIDGVLDKEYLGFPCSTAAGVRALAQLHAHGVALTFNTARTLREVQAYCEAYGGVGGVAEYGAVAWDAVRGRVRALVTPASHDQLRRVAAALRKIPGVFLSDRYQHSLRAYTYLHDRTAPLPTGLIQGVLAETGADRLVVHQSYRDTAVLAREADKGTGLRALLELAGQEQVETIAIGDSEPDLPMFCAAQRSYAPRHIAGRGVARLLGCTIASRSYQLGLLAAVEAIVHGAEARCTRCVPALPDGAQGLFWSLLVAADQSALRSIARACTDPAALRAFLR